MTSQEIWAMLRRGGLSVEVPAPDTGASAGEPVLVGRYHGMLDPAGVDRLGVLLADKARTVDPNLVVVGEGANDLILGFVVARELALPLVRALNLEGLVRASGAFPANPRGVFVADRVHKWSSRPPCATCWSARGASWQRSSRSSPRPCHDSPVECLGLVTAEEGLSAIG